MCCSVKEAATVPASFRKSRLFRLYILVLPGIPDQHHQQCNYAQWNCEIQKYGQLVGNSFCQPADPADPVQEKADHEDCCKYERRPLKHLCGKSLVLLSKQRGKVHQIAKP